MKKSNRKPFHLETVFVIALLIAAAVYGLSRIQVWQSEQKSNQKFMAFQQNLQQLARIIHEHPQVLHAVVKAGRFEVDLMNGIGWKWGLRSKGYAMRLPWLRQQFPEIAFPQWDPSNRVGLITAYWPPEGPILQQQKQEPLEHKLYYFALMMELGPEKSLDQKYAFFPVKLRLDGENTLEGHPISYNLFDPTNGMDSKGAIIIDSRDIGWRVNAPTQPTPTPNPNRITYRPWIGPFSQLALAALHYVYPTPGPSGVWVHHFPNQKETGAQTHKTLPTRSETDTDNPQNHAYH